MLHAISTWPAILAFSAAGFNNALGRTTVKDDYVRWGYPAWWCYVTAVLEFLTAVLIAISATRVLGLLLGAVIIAAAVLTVLRHRDMSHLLPLSAFAVLLVIGAVLPRV